ncbi:MAG: A/G-specific adenine glycosylase [Clostridiales Family XIII bacterium]|nr:A/G-specific adenine glycosylase [Clostridiales Family XIII bacterium]
MRKDRIDASLPALLIAWYDANARDLPWRADRAPYHVWLSEIMLQQTRAAAVIPYYLRFLRELPTIEALAKAPDERLMKLWEGLGYYSRARNLKKTAQIIVHDCGGAFPQRLDALLKLPGVGSYTAAAIASICFDLPTPAVDGNVLRVVTRLLDIREPIDDTRTKHRVADALADIYPQDRPGAFTQSLMELGATLCAPAGLPACSVCPLHTLCKASRNGTVSSVPARREKKAKREEGIAVLILSCDGSVAIRRRPNRGLLAGMWELPNVRDTFAKGSVRPGQNDARSMPPAELPNASASSQGKTDDEMSEDETSRAQAVVDLAALWGAKPVSVTKSVRRTHIFTHIKWNMTGYYIECSQPSTRFTWASAEELAEIYALPAAFRQFLPATM